MPTSRGCVWRSYTRQDSQPAASSAAPPGRLGAVHQITPHPATPRVLDLPSGPVAVLDAAPAAGVPPRGTAVLVPGYAGSKEDFSPILGGLADAGFRAVAVDQPGQHESPGPPVRRAYAVDILAGAVLEAVDHLSSDPVHLLGHSFGGLVCRAAAIAARHRLLSLVLMGSGPAAIAGERRKRMQILEPVFDNGGMPAVLAAMEELDRLNPQRVEAPPELRTFLRRRFLASTPEGLQGMGDALRDEPDRVAELAATGLPLLVAYGEDDDAWSPTTQADMAARLGARHEVITGAAHSPAVEQPARTIAVLIDFWRAVEDSSEA